MSALAMAGMQVAGGVASYFSSKAQAKYEQKLVEYQRSVNHANYVINSANLQRNKVMADEQIASAEQNIQQEHLLNKGAATVAAAAMGASGNSVGQSLAVIDQAAAQERYNLDIQADYSNYQYNSQTVALELEKAGAYIPDAVEPDIMSAVFGTLGNAGSAYMKYK